MMKIIVNLTCAIKYIKLFNFGSTVHGGQPCVHIAAEA